MKGLIVDVRSNPGGLVTSVVDILDQILPEGTVVYTEDKYGKKKRHIHPMRPAFIIRWQF